MKDAREDWRHYKTKLIQYKKIKEGLGRVKTHISATVAKEHMIYVKNIKSVHKILRALHIGYALSDFKEKDQIK